jgi:hypothetical protein
MCQLVFGPEHGKIIDRAIAKSHSEENEFLRHQVQAAHAFIRGLHKRATGYGSTFSEGVVVDCEAFFRDNPKPRKSTHEVVTRRYLKTLQSRALESLKLKAELRKERKQ